MKGRRRVDVFESMDLLQNPDLDLAAVRRVFSADVLEALEIEGDGDLLDAISIWGVHHFTENVLAFMGEAVTRSGGHGALRVKVAQTLKRAHEEGFRIQRP
jgi:hypothetical protein|tara:strand:+ start:11156 stop:11458 length:303 start_codon:yes stop_codon:yes gene_type:complete